jgi:hypothetical protein
MQPKVCHYKISQTESRPCLFNQLRTAKLKKAQTWASGLWGGLAKGNLRA